MAHWHSQRRPAQCREIASGAPESRRRHLCTWASRSRAVDNLERCRLRNRPCDADDGYSAALSRIGRHAVRGCRSPCCHFTSNDPAKCCKGSRRNGAHRGVKRSELDHRSPSATDQRLSDSTSHSRGRPYATWYATVDQSRGRGDFSPRRGRAAGACPLRSGCRCGLKDQNHSAINSGASPQFFSGSRLRRCATSSQAR
jgi:hypothetical protein